MDYHVKKKARQNGEVKTGDLEKWTKPTYTLLGEKSDKR